MSHQGSIPVPVPPPSRVAPGSRSSTRRRRAFLLSLLLICVALATAWEARAPLLRGAAALWVVSDPLEQADAVVIFGGGLDLRPFAAADLYRRGLVKRILVSDVKPSRTEQLGVLPIHTELNRLVLRKLGVPEDAMVVFGKDLSNTFEEVRALLDWAEASGARKLILPTDLFSSRRVRWVLDRLGRGRHIGISVQPVAPLEYGLDTWWQHEQGVVAFQNEVLKYFYYRLKY